MNGKLSDGLVGSLVGGRYRVAARLAMGGMATVYLATDTNLDRDVALKVLHPHLSQDPSFAERLEQEAKAAARLSHPHVVSVLDRGHDGDVFYLVMEYVPGRNLRELLDEHGPLAPRQALALIDAVVDGLAAAHAAGLVHRDIKPENVLLGDSGQIKVADFGLARAVTTSTTSGVTMGTVAYIAPELVQRSGGDERSDLYSVGIMLYELLTGHQPYRGDLPVQVAMQHATRDVPPPSDLVPGLSPELDELVQWACAREPEDRPVDAEALLGEIRHIRTHLSDAQLDLHSAQTQHIPYPQRGHTEMLPSGRTEVIAAAPHPQHTSVIPAGTAPTAREQRRRDREAARRSAAAAATPTRTLGPGRSRRRGAVWAAVIVVLALVAALAGWFFGVGPGAAATVPPVKDLTVDQARPLFDQAGLSFSTQDVFDDAVTAGLIVNSTPAPGTQIRKFQGVSVLVSKGPQLFPLEDLRGKSLDDAKAAITAAKDTVGAVKEAYDDTVPAGIILAQDPGPGTSLRHGSTVALTVSKGPQPIPVPRVVGMPQSQALAALRAAGLDPQVSSDEVNDRTVPKGAVAAQDPAPGATLTKGGAVTLTMSKGPKMVHVPSFVGKQVGQATDELKRLGFDVRVENILGGFFGTVRAQDPVDKDVPEGSVVTLTVV
ncbi:protein kinase [Sinomonas atrocyanea]|uniref:non-specific serine/threonine protein kinase n=1 Tax=Sinomonas atrocyanea TaxID=37927 RepID=A0A126ZZ57_9MICC|nr:Stk1 family PASTA domain-containing Ser/Thr kinase [Sinomonas atrocyanea]AMM32470.1 protein kinase [Sinomonas atrocyanea]GEB63537.1 serine/threonine protein kinase [Sinomonas atrocyanea]GGG59898.1 serine/threonine protein kinase [Sinomonas atrocyanea]